MRLARARICTICGCFCVQKQFCEPREGISLLPTLDTTSEEFQQRFRHLNLQNKSHEGWIDWQIYSHTECLTK